MMMARRKKGLSERHKKILAFLKEYQIMNNYPPSIREIGENTGISSTSVVNYYLDQLEKMGHIERDRKISRGVRLAASNPLGEMAKIPILGPIAAGIPLPELQPGVQFTDSEADAVDIAASLLPSEKTDDLYALEVQGDSMLDAMINDGDIVVIKHTIEANNGDMVAVWLPEDNEATLKYFFKETNGFRLQPANPTHEPLFYDKDTPLEIKGKVVMVIRQVDKLM
jgi:repressor LexA